MNSNLRAFNLAVQTLLTNPSQFLPHLTIPTFTSLPEQLGPAIASSSASTTSSTPTNPPDNPEKPPKIQIKALILDKDNTLSPPKTTHLPAPILQKLTSLRTSPTSPFTAPSSILIVSNRAGSHPSYDSEIHSLESQLAHLSIPVFRLPPGASKKPFCESEVLAWFKERGVVEHAGEIAVVGDRLGTDVLMAVRMGAWSVWCRDGVLDESGGVRAKGVLEKMEVYMERYLREGRGLRAPWPARPYSSASGSGSSKKTVG
ncbi:phosphatidylglycerophosphatase [Aspergillus candidus]|uniref:Mitochondrial PGP phosphatase-domain-containing protein n=1 Tax=Aspergillus candidus TaxID=41067 RepID=A0A2I2FC55_ASPCN|nr:mitochondrial PGP phosphatase-domain-containing protein [Aspergillus candidus]PLB38210.1 mitochondrial PGP phosphatase-domain-containing protein [Aspergillus candidus]